MVGQMTLDHPVQVRILVLQPILTVSSTERIKPRSEIEPMNAALSSSGQDG